MGHPTAGARRSRVITFTRNRFSCDVALRLQVIERRVMNAGADARETQEPR